MGVDGVSLGVDVVSLGVDVVSLGVELNVFLGKSRIHVSNVCVLF